ncbi:putative transcriptional regulator [Methanofollis sp. W23]|uniref:winged helix-turn-helix transcriptional regulator n=1 Tax=Methanofollis sp. W23 TaxID=2817849 RepID=UPI001AE2D0E1|nr:winged helix-turn-helix transcriptional regulator [Methanofollis sp. W23]MBP2145926.1 putative transcriptional regulator [Methanofollis sp. W23]
MHRTPTAIIILILILLLVPIQATAKIIVEPIPPEIPTDGINLDDEEIVPIWSVPPMQLLTYYMLIYCPALAVPIKFLYSFGILAFFGYRCASRRLSPETSTRRQILMCISDNPGITVSEIAGATEISRGTVNYHLFRLQRKGLVHRTGQGNTFGYFAYSETLNATEEHLLIHLKSQTKKKLISLLMETPDISQSEAAETVKVSRATITWHMKKLIRDGLVESRKEGRTMHYRLTPDAGEILGKEMKEETEEEKMDTGPATA